MDCATRRDPSEQLLYTVQFAVTFFASLKAKWKMAGTAVPVTGPMASGSMRHSDCNLRSQEIALFFQQEDMSQFPSTSS